MRYAPLLLGALCLVAAIALAAMPRVDAQSLIDFFIPIVEQSDNAHSAAPRADAPPAPPSDILPTAPRPEGLEQATETAKDQAPVEGSIVFASGLETAGETFTLYDGRTVDLPDTMFIKHNIVGVFCEPGAWCATAPFVILGEVESPDVTGIGVQLTDGVVFASSAEQAALAGNYTEVLVQLEADSIVVDGTPVPLEVK